MGKRRVYVMDCGAFVKIGVSVDVNRRKDQIQHDVFQYYCTEPIENAFDIEKFMHKVLSPLLNKNAGGREYFDISFETAKKLLSNAIVSEKSERDKTVDAILSTINEENSIECTESFYSFVADLINMDKGNQAFLYSVACGLLARKEINEKARE